jgi:hypothetical protein
MTEAKAKANPMWSMTVDTVSSQMLGYDECENSLLHNLNERQTLSNLKPYSIIPSFT